VVNRNPDFYSQPRPKLEPSVCSPRADERETALSTVNDFSLVFGKPLYDFLQRHRILHVGLPTIFNIFTRIMVLVALT
jgi:hypothetical protein